MSANDHRLEPLLGEDKKPLRDARGEVMYQRVEGIPEEKPGLVAGLRNKARAEAEAAKAALAAAEAKEQAIATERAELDRIRAELRAERADLEAKEREVDAKAAEAAKASAPTPAPRR